MSDLTPELVRAYWAAMTARFGASVIDKSSATEMQIVATVLGQLGILDRDAFLEHFTTTIGHRIYTSFDVGTPTPTWSLWGQIMVCAHECQHIVQYDQLGALRFGWQYVTSTAARARLEAEAYRCQLELEHWRTGRILSPHQLASSLKNYAVTDADIKVAEVALAMSAESVRRGAVINPTSRFAIDWLSAHAPQIRTVGA